MISKDQYDQLYREFLKNIRKAQREIVKDAERSSRIYDSKSYQYTDIADSIARVMNGGSK